MTFAERLFNLGFVSYRQYLSSPHWQEFRGKYRASTLPQSCIACSKTPYQLHHHTYERLGCEKIGDVVPLCDDCHKQVHAFAKEHKLGVHATDRILGQINGWSFSEIKSRFAPFKNPESLPGQKVWTSSETNPTQRKKKKKSKKQQDQATAKVGLTSGPREKFHKPRKEPANYLTMMAARVVYHAAREAVEKRMDADTHLRPALGKLLEELRIKGGVLR